MPTQKSPREILAEFHDQFNHDDPNGRAIVAIKSYEEGTSQTPIQNELIDFLQSSLQSLILYIAEEARPDLISCHHIEMCSCEGENAAINTYYENIKALSEEIWKII